MEKSLQHQYRAFPPALTQGYRFFKIEHGKTVGCAQRIPDTFNAVSVRIGFHHRPDAGVRRGLAGNGQVLFQRLQVNAGQYRASHLTSLSVMCAM
ncbi:Uncharacterised protein [Citrobacter freundii]|nr:Uncharacterised protein [Citrobacter freundii]